ncbi:MAG: hypothetical protein Q9160_000941 [Pyrenula sp. 1 TL-2023]
MPSPTRSTTQDIAQLQSTAERVTRQAEDFAKCLDKFVMSRPSKVSTEAWKGAHSTLKTFQKNAQARANSLSNNGPSRSPARKHSARSAANSRIKPDAQHCHQEADLWELLSGTISLQSPGNQASVAEHQSKAFLGLNRYSSDSDRWDAFLETDGYAQEAVAILSWLQRTADTAGLPIEALTEDLRFRSERGDGIWASGWLYTKETIKGQKRLWEWSRYVEPKERHELQMSQKTDGADLVTQLDPDAALRQARQRCEEDDFYEAANWLSCWELLRRGKSWSYLRDYWAERHEDWRSASILGDLPFSELTDAEEGLTWMRAYGSERMWTLTCRALAEQDGIDSYEAAVYALLSSDTDRSMRVCQTFDDYLFVLLNSLVLERYDRFCRTLDAKLQNPMIKAKSTYEPIIARESYEKVRLLINKLALNEKTRSQTSEPLKMIQATLVCKDYGDFFATQGKAAAKVYQTNKSPSPFYDDLSAISQKAAMDVVRSPESMLILVHAQLILQKLGYFDGDNQRRRFLDNNIVAHMMWLQNEGKIEAIPLYASCLSPPAAASALGQILTSVTAEGERDLIVGLLRKYEIPLPDVLTVMFEQLCPDHASDIDISQFCQVSVTEYGDPQHPRQLKVRTGITTADITDEERNLIHCLEWHGWVNGDAWDQCCMIATTLLKRFIFHGRLSAAWFLIEQASLSRLSLRILHVDLCEDESPTDTSESESPAKRSPATHQENLTAQPMDIQLIKKQATTWRELEELAYVLSALEAWAVVAEQTEEHRNDPNQIRKCKVELSKCLEQVQTWINYCVLPDWLRLPLTPDEAPLLHTIRTYYLPEFLLAQTSILYFAGHYLSRDHLAQCMEVAITIASTEGLAETVQEANRMRELMNQLAGVSKSLLLANERGSKKRSKEGTAVNVGIWQVKPEEVGLEKEMGRAK